MILPQITTLALIQASDLFVAFLVFIALCFAAAIGLIVASIWIRRG